MEFAETARGLMTPTEARLWWEFFDASSGRATKPWAGWPMTSVSILFARPDDLAGPGDGIDAQHVAAPDFFADLNLDQIVDAVTANWAEYDLQPLFQVPLRDIDAIGYRHEVFQDMEKRTLIEHVEAFAVQMRHVRAYLALANKLYDRYHKEAWFLHAVEIYCDAVKRFAADLLTVPLKSRGFVAFRDYLTAYAASEYFIALLQEAKTLTALLSELRYCVLVHDGSFTVRNYESEGDYSAEIEETFARFKQGAVTDYRVKYRSSPEEMNFVEAKILEFVARLNAGLFSRLADFRAQHADFVDETIAVFDREIHFYVAYLQHVEKLERAGLQFCYPHVSSTSKQVYDYDGFDLALAQKLINAKGRIVSNDFSLTGSERVIVVTGPNQGGKTTFARAFGQLHFLASIGCPVPGREAKLLLCEELFTHFEREERVENLRGKLEDDLARIGAILERATPRSVIIMNEIFTSTTLQDEIFLGRKVMEKIVELDLLCVWVTFVDELASYGDEVVSMVSTVVPENPALRTFKIVRRPADGLAYATAIAEKYRLTYDCVRQRIAKEPIKS